MVTATTSFVQKGGIHSRHPKTYEIALFLTSGPHAVRVSLVDTLNSIKRCIQETFSSGQSFMREAIPEKLICTAVRFWENELSVLPSCLSSTGLAIYENETRLYLGNETSRLEVDQLCDPCSFLTCKAVDVPQVTCVGVPTRLSLTVAVNWVFMRWSK